MIPWIVTAASNTYPSSGQDERLNDVVSCFKDYDIVAVQECFGGLFSETREKFTSMAMKAGFIYYTEDQKPPFASTYVLDGGVMIFSRFPIVAHSSQPYDYSQETDGLARRGAVYAKIQIQESHLHVFSTHMCSTHMSPPDRAHEIAGAAFECRQEQCKKLATFADEVLDQTFDPKSDEVIITGDFNILRYKYPVEFQKSIVAINGSEYNKCMNYCNVEYERTLRPALEKIEDFQLHDLWDTAPPNTKKLTFADTIIDEKTGEEIPAENILTLPIEAKSKQVLDYIFYLQYKNRNARQKLKINKKSLKVENFNVQQLLAKGILKQFKTGKERPYTQLSDHYGISMVINYS